MHRIYPFLLIAVLLVVTAKGQEDKKTCPWIIRLKTGSDEAASTNATISALISDKPFEETLWSEPDINEYIIRANEEGYVPFRKDQEDVFEFQGPCDELTCFSIYFENSEAGADPSWQLASVEADVTSPTGTLTYKDNQGGWCGGGFPNTIGVSSESCVAA